MKDIIEYDGELYLVNDMINFSKYGSDIKDLLYLCIKVTNLPNKVKFCDKDYAKLRLKGTDIEPNDLKIDRCYSSKSTCIKDGQLYYKYKLEKD